MALFKEIHCKHCDKKTNLLTRIKLADDSYICSVCKAGIPNYIHLSDYTYDGFLALKAYLEESEIQLKRVFRETHSYMGIHLDAEHGLFYVGDWGKHLYLKLENLEDFDLDFVADEYKEGIFSEKVTGKVGLNMKMQFPYFYKEEVLATGVKASARTKGIFGNKVEYENPKGMNDFLHSFATAWRRALEKEQRQAIAEAEQLLQEVASILDEPV